MSYVAFMVMGHGSLITQTNEQGLTDIVPIEYPNINMQMCTFAPPLECSVYPDDSLLLLRKTLKKYLKDVNTIETFQQAVGQAQLDAIRFKYSDPEWAGHPTIHPKSYFRSENWVVGNKCVDKTFSDANEIFVNGESGIYILNNNIGLKNKHIPFENGRTTLSTFINSLSGMVNNICMLDTTCSVIHEEISERSERLIIKNIALLFQSTKNGRAKGFTKKISKKRKSKKRNKTIQNNRKK